jgi:hypothetical protein
VEVVDGRADHPWNGRHGFENDRPVPVTLGKEGVGAKAEQLGEAESDAVGEAFGAVVD